jgi:FAD/FMN-containing dehydrogenase
VSVGVGAIWMDVYDAVTTTAGRYVQGGGCTTVGVAGLVQGGGFGSFSKGCGTAAADLLEAEVVTADGAARIANAVRDRDLFWALKGSGGGTFGVVTRLTLCTMRCRPTSVPRAERAHGEGAEVGAQVMLEQLAVAADGSQPDCLLGPEVSEPVVQQVVERGVCRPSNDGVCRTWLVEGDVDMAPERLVEC